MSNVLWILKGVGNSDPLRVLIEWLGKRGTASVQLQPAQRHVMGDCKWRVS